MLWVARKFPTTWDRALSCYKINYSCCTKGTATGRRTPFLYFITVKLPAVTINTMRNTSETIKEPPTNLPHDNASIDRGFYDVDHLNRDPSVTRTSPLPHRTSTPYDACDVPELGADRHTYGVPKYQPRAIDFSQFRGWRGDYECQP